MSASETRPARTITVRELRTAVRALKAQNIRPISKQAGVDCYPHYAISFSNRQIESDISAILIDARERCKCVIFYDSRVDAEFFDGMSFNFDATVPAQSIRATGRGISCDLELATGNISFAQSYGQQKN